mmetsp:Transcript_60247/g.140325  ORF Transcript_60247/g.140325 Transcript_60247/m.140325 type:complete len:211 (+) Transcript_60247:188-820(+)
MVSQRVGVLRLQAVGLQLVEEFLWVVTLGLCSPKRLACKVAVVLLVPIFERLHEARLALLHEVLDVHDVHLERTMLLKGFTVLLLGVLEALDERVLLFVDELLLALRAFVGLLPRQAFLGLVNLTLARVCGEHGLAHLLPALSQLSAVLLKGALVLLALTCLPVCEGPLALRRPRVAFWCPWPLRWTTTWLGRLRLCRGGALEHQLPRRP